MSAITRLFAGRLAGMVVRGPDTEPIGRVRDVMVTIRPGTHTNRILGLVVELVNNKRRIFVPMLRVAAIEPQDITLVSGSVSMRAFQRRTGEQSIMNDIIGAAVRVDDPALDKLHGRALSVTDVQIEQGRTRDWVISRVAVQGPKSTFGRRAALEVVEWRYVHGLSASAADHDDDTAELLAKFADLRPADAAQLLTDLSPAERTEVAQEMDEEQLADILQELPEDRQAVLIESIPIERAADVLEEMDPDDAADLLGELGDVKADVLLELMDPEESAPVRRLLHFDDDTVGAIMTPEPVILPPQTTVAEALATVRNPDLQTSLASLVFVCRPPTGTPTGRYLGCVHIQKLLREPPSTLISGILDPDLPPLFAEDSTETAARYFATYNLVCGPVLDKDNHLLGAVSVDDLLDHMLPAGWREGGIRA